MKAMVVGLGSMGKRRIRLIKQHSPEAEIIGVDLSEERCQSIEKEQAIKTYQNLHEALSIENGECAFISTAPLSHSDIIKECLNGGLHVFTELNLVDNGYDENIELAKRKKKTLFLSSTFMYRPEIKYIADRVHKSNVKSNYNYHVGQYLPDWHPWEDYKSYFVGNKRTNGCREILAIELPWLTYAFGEIKKIKVTHDRMTTLDINYDDNYLLIIEHVTGHKGLLSVDIASRKAVRNFEVFSEDYYIEWDGSPTGLSEYDIISKSSNQISLYNDIDHLDNYSSFVIENAYYDEIASFFNIIRGVETPIYTFEKDKTILRLIDDIERGENN